MNDDHECEYMGRPPMCEYMGRPPMCECGKHEPRDGGCPAADLHPKTCGCMPAKPPRSDPWIESSEKTLEEMTKKLGCRCSGWDLMMKGHTNGCPEKRT